MDDLDNAPADGVSEAAPAVQDPKRDQAQAIVDAWRNQHFNSVPTQAWDIYSAAEPHLVAAIAAVL